LARHLNRIAAQQIADQEVVRVRGKIVDIEIDRVRAKVLCRVLIDSVTPNFTRDANVSVLHDLSLISVRVIFSHTNVPLISFLLDI
jgi:hypothetical protein